MSWKNTARWKNSDPRGEIEGKVRIVVLASQTDAFTATVETIQGYYVDLDRTGDVRTLIAENDEWPSQWWWVRGPRSTRLRLVMEPPHG